MVKEYYANAQQRLAIKNRQKKVDRYKLYKQYKKEIAHDDAYSTGAAASTSGVEAAEREAGSDSTARRASAPRSGRSAGGRRSTRRGTRTADEAPGQSRADDVLPGADATHAD